MMAPPGMRPVVCTASSSTATPPLAVATTTCDRRSADCSGATSSRPPRSDSADRTLEQCTSIDCPTRSASAGIVASSSTMATLSASRREDCATGLPSRSSVRANASTVGAAPLPSPVPRRPTTSPTPVSRSGFCPYREQMLSSFTRACAAGGAASAVRRAHANAAKGRGERGVGRVFFIGASCTSDRVPFAPRTSSLAP